MLIDEDDLVIKLLYACENSNMEKVKYYLTSSMLEKKPNINDSREIYKYNFYTPLMLAIEKNNIQLIEYLLLSPDLSEHANINSVCSHLDTTYGSCPLSIAIKNRLENVVKFLLHSPLLKEHATVCPTLTTIELNIINGKREIKENTSICYSPLRESLLSDNINILNIILAESEFKNNKKLVTDIINNTLDNLFQNKNITTISYLLTNNYMEKNSNLDKHIEAITDRHFYTSIIKLMNTIDLKNDMDNNLNIKPKLSNKIKI